jgi:hypothetical protein
LLTFEPCQRERSRALKTTNTSNEGAQSVEKGS